MSTIVCLAEGDRVVLGTDSRFMSADYSEVASDSTPKITEAGDGTFLATTGWSIACDFQAEAVPRLAREVGTDIKKLAGALDAASHPCLASLAGQLSTMGGLRVEPEADGWKPLHSFLLAGHSGGKLGYTYVRYWFRDGALRAEKRAEYFGSERRMEVTAGKSVAYLAKDARTWVYSAVDVVKMFLAEQKRVNPQIGGPDQIVLIERDGARWISRLPVQERLKNGQLARAVCTAEVSFTAPTLIIQNTNPPVRVNIDKVNWVKVSHGTANVYSQLRYDQLLVQDSTNSNRYARYELTQLKLSQSINFNVTLDAGALALTNSGASATATTDGLYIGGQRIVGSRQSRPTDLAGVIALLVAHGLCD